MTNHERRLKTSAWGALLLIAASFLLPVIVAQAQSASGPAATCVVSVTTTSASVSALMSAQSATCTSRPSGNVRFKVVGATSICVGGTDGTTGDPAALAAGNKCFPMSTGDDSPTAIRSSDITLRTQSGTSLVAVWAVDG